MAKEKRTVDIHGKQYETVASRVERFRKEKDYGINTVLLQNDETLVVMKATIKDGDRIVACGHAEEKRASSQINKTSALENCETSAIGRALACLGYIGTEFASADEVAQAIHQQTRTETKPAYKKPEIVQEPANNPPQQTTQQEPDKTLISDKQVGRFFGKGKEFGWSTDELKELIKTFHYEHTKDIKRDDYARIIETIEKGIAPKDKREELLDKIKKDSDENIASLPINNGGKQPAKKFKLERTPMETKILNLKTELHDDIWYMNTLVDNFNTEEFDEMPEEKQEVFATLIKFEIDKRKKGFKS